MAEHKKSCLAVFIFLYICDPELLFACEPFPFDVLGMMWDSVPDRRIFSYF